MLGADPLHEDPRTAVAPADTALSDIEFERFYRDQWGSIFKLCLALGGKRAVAEELAQDAFVAAFRNWEAVSRLDSPGAWVRRVALNRSVSHIRRVAVETRVLLSGRSRQSVEALDPHNDQVWAAVRSLPSRQAQVVALTIIEDRSVTDIASILGVTEDTVRTHWRRARITLADILGATEEEDC